MGTEEDREKKERKQQLLNRFRKPKSTAANALNPHEVPKKMWVTTIDTAAGGEHLPNPARSASGLYLLVDGKAESAMNVWEQVGGQCRIEGSEKGHWVVTEAGRPKIISLQTHDGKFPHQTGVFRTRHFEQQRGRERDRALELGFGVWRQEGTEHEIGVDGDALITASEATCHGFRYGRAVVANTDIRSAKGAVIIPISTLGIILGRSRRHPATHLRLKFDSMYSSMDVPHTHLDLADGPTVMVSRNGIHQYASVVNVADTRVKLSFHGCPKTDDEWFDKHSTSITPAFVENDGIMEGMSDGETISDEGYDSYHPQRGTYL